MTGNENKNSHPAGSPFRSAGSVKIFLVGFMGCGKTHWGQRLAEKLTLPFFDLDLQIEEKEEKNITEIFAAQGEEHFRLLEKDVLHLVTESHDSFIMATGGGTPCFYNNIDYMKAQGVVVWINCPVDCLHGRLLKEKEKRPLIRDLSDDQLHAYITKKYADRKIYYRQASVIIDGENLTLENLLNKIVHI